MKYRVCAIMSFLLMMPVFQSEAMAADGHSQFFAGSKPAAKTPSQYIPPTNHNQQTRRPGYDFHESGRPRDHHPGKPGYSNRNKGAASTEPTKPWYGAKPGNSLNPGFNRNHSRHRNNRGYNCHPYCGVVSYSDYGYWEQERQQAVAPQPVEPERSFQGGGVFERFEDPRDVPAHDAGYPGHSGEPAGQSPAQADMDQYHMMMETWRQP